MLARFVQSVDQLVRQLDFAAAIAAHRWPLVPRVRVLELQAVDVQAAAAGRGEDGIDVCRLIAQAVQQLEPIVQAHDSGDLTPWRTARPEVCGILAQLREFLVEPQLEVEARAAPVVPARPAATSPPSSAQAHVDGWRKGEKGRLLSLNARRVVSVLLEHGATNEADRVTRRYLVEETRLSDAVVRRAIEDELHPHGLLESKVGRDGGVWLSTAGIQAGKSLTTK